MINANLSELFETLSPPDGDNAVKLLRFSACKIPGAKRYRLAKDNIGNPCLLIEVFGPTKDYQTPIKLQNLNVLFNANCQVLDDGEFGVNRFTVISCTDNDENLQQYFLKLIATIISVLGENPTSNEVAKSVEKLVELFRAIRGAPRKSVQGLWAELFLISLARNKATLVRSWHQSPMDKYDFVFADQRVEVKSCSSMVRSHVFSLEQLSPGIDLEIIIASIIVLRAGAGATVNELADQIRKQLWHEPGLLLMLDQTIASTLGSDWKKATQDRFDADLAKKTLKYFSAEEVPTIKTELPREVSEVRFKVDLSGIEPLQPGTFAANKGGILGELEI